MYEFLAPWGILVPALSAALIYLIITDIRRKKMLSLIEAPEEPGYSYDRVAMVSGVA